MKTTIVSIFTFGLMFAVSAAFAQPPDSLWSRTFGGSNAEICSVVDQTNDGGYFVAGATASFGAGGYDFWLIKTDENGDSLWSHTFGGNGANDADEVCRAALQLPVGGYLLAGATASFGAGSSDFWLVAANSQGDSLASHTFGGDNEDACFAMQRTADNGIALAGYTFSFGAGGDFWLVKTNVQGDSLWSRTYGGNLTERCTAILQTSDEGFVLAGYAASFGSGGNDFWLVKTDANGDSLWSHSYGGSENDECHALAQTADGGYVLFGTTYSFGTGDADFWLVKTNADGDSLWSRTFGGDGDELGTSVYETSEGNFIMAGSRYPSGSPTCDYWMIETDANGDSLWSRTFGGGGSDLCSVIRPTNNDGYILGGATNSFGSGYTDIWIVKAVSVPNTLGDFSFHPSSFALSCYPNPFNPSTAISFDLPRAMNAQLRIFDISGRVVTTLADEHFTAGAHTILFDASALSSGSYFARLAASGQSRTVKMQLLK